MEIKFFKNAKDVEIEEGKEVVFSLQDCNGVDLIVVAKVISIRTTEASHVD
jgi:hypothetical protein